MVVSAAAKAFSLLQGPATDDLLFDGGVEDEDVIDDKQDDDEAEARDVPLDKHDDRVDRGGQQRRQVKERKYGVEQLYLTTVAERRVTGSIGTFAWPRLLPVGTLAMASTTSIPETTLPKTQ